MHGIWTLMIVPLAATFAWRLSIPQMITIAKFSMYGFVVGLLGWAGTLCFAGAADTSSFYERLLGSARVIFSSINVPLVQLILGSLVIIKWPKSWKFNPQQH